MQEEQFRLKSKVIIGHVRAISCGNQAHHNTHPFQINNYVFAHNGTVSAIMNMPEFRLNIYKSGGETDSEYAFCYLMEKLLNKDAGYIKKVLKTETANIKQYGNFNFLLSDGETLYVHGHTSLYYVKRKAPFDTVTLRDDNYTVNLQEIKTEDEKAVLIATQPLTTNEKWKKISEIKGFRDGEEI